MTLKDPFSKREAEKYEQPVASRELILSVIQDAPIPPTFNALLKTFNYTDENNKVGLKRRLRAMESSGQIIFNKFKQYAIVPKNSVLTGRVSGHRDGFGFFIPDVAPGEKPSKDLYISAHEMKRVIHGDIVEAILVDRTDRKGRKEVRILDVIQPRKSGVVGRLFVEKHIVYMKPDDARIKIDILIDPNERMGARHGQVVVVEVTQRPSKRANAVGKVVEVLGEHMAPGMEIEIALREHDLPHEFSAEVMEEVSVLSDEVEEAPKACRKDLRNLPLVTIDGEDARDFDDAVYCKPNEKGGWTLWVAIADVSYYVRDKTALDDEAISRGNSVYFPSQVIPMLPEKLSNGLCSLNPNVDRLCMVCEMSIDAQGELVDSTFYSAVMRSHARFTYTKVAAILDGDEALKAEYAALVPDLENLNSMYQALNDSRLKRGAIAFETEESKFIFNDDKKIASIESLVRNDAHKIIEECMILANVSTAKFIEQHKAHGLFRVHEKPSGDKYNNFVTYIRELGIETPAKEEPTPADYGQILKRIADRPDQELIQTMLLRSMKQAVYQSDNLGHFGLALESYSHFTSPIRRYPDLVVHRVIKAILEKQSEKKLTGANDGEYTYTSEQVIELGEHCSMTERRADDATRDVSDWLKCEFMQDHIGDSFNGVISTVTNFGLFVRLANLGIEGLIHINSLGRDYYRFDEVRLCLTGENTGTKYKVGDAIEVKVAAVNLDEKKIDLMIDGVVVDEKNQRRSRSPRKGMKKNSASDKGVKKGAKKSKGTPATVSSDTKKTKAKAKKKRVRKPRPGKNARSKAK
ncbi:ribonuclease R [Colwellia sp. UCD-KL20]|uniref:ribonuclease R n=1 Tax=Colwellia sp. UCD-KL20 TaxID=1917165 RepID=UPI00097083F5|nr:ribonuclease R [Colwellia sp. UCD-KL20]